MSLKINEVVPGKTCFGCGTRERVALREDDCGGAPHWFCAKCHGRTCEVRSEQAFAIRTGQS